MNKAIKKNYVFLICLGLIILNGGWSFGEILDYEVTAVNAQTWVITAKEITSGDILSFKLPPSAFHGQTFDAKLEGLVPGQKFEVRGPKNAPLNDLIVERPTRRAGEKSRGRSVKRMARTVRRLAWEIESVDSAEWIITAKNKNNKTIRFKVDPQSFIGFRFRADLSGIEKGAGFTLIAPNDSPITKNCTLLK